MKQILLNEKVETFLEGNLVRKALILELNTCSIAEIAIFLKLREQKNINFPKAPKTTVLKFLPCSLNERP